MVECDTFRLNVHDGAFKVLFLRNCYEEPLCRHGPCLQLLNVTAWCEAMALGRWPVVIVVLCPLALLM
jgi:hypothetical protein